MKKTMTKFRNPSKESPLLNESRMRNTDINLNQVVTKLRIGRQWIINIYHDIIIYDSINFQFLKTLYFPEIKGTSDKFNVRTEIIGQRIITFSFSLKEIRILQEWIQSLKMNSIFMIKLWFTKLSAEKKKMKIPKLLSAKVSSSHKCRAQLRSFAENGFIEFVFSQNFSWKSSTHWNKLWFKN